MFGVVIATVLRYHQQKSVFVLGKDITEATKRCECIK